MAGTATAGRQAPVAVDHSAAMELLLRLIGAALQVLATWAVVRVLDPDAAGVYFRGFVIACGMATLLRAKYELYLAHHIIGRRAAVTGICDGALLMQLSRRVALRSSLVCGVLLVITADLDIQAPRLQPVLETYLPFVLAIPCVSFSTLVGEALRAANRTLLGTVIAAYALNLSILLAVLLAPPDASLTLYAWAFFGGSLAAAGLAMLLARWAFPCEWELGGKPITREVLDAVDERAVIGLSRGVLQWGPLCILAVAAPALQMAQYAVAVRTAMIVDYFLPALNLSGSRDFLRGQAPIPGSPQAPRRLLLTQLGNALLYSSVFVAVLVAAAPASLRLYGYPYEAQIALYVLLLGVQWANSVGRPAVRHAVADWDAPRIQAAVGSGAVAALLICAFAISGYGALAAAAASLAGALLLNLWAIRTALSRARQSPVAP
jgi:hypothetical protein